MTRMFGIIGGMGPEATVDFYREVLRLTPARNDQEHIPVLIYSNPQIPERTKAILEGGVSPLPMLVETARLLEQAGAGALAMPCNTAHYYFEPLQSSIQVPIFHMIKETADGFSRRVPDGRRVGLLATTGTVRSGIYQQIFDRKNIDVLTADPVDQDSIMDGIRKIKAATHDEVTALMFEAIGARLVKSGAQAVILGCTEIPLAFNESRAGYLTLNATRILAQAAVDWALGRRA